MNHGADDIASLRGGLTQAMFRKAVFPRMDALVAFVPEGGETFGNIKEAVDKFGEGRWFPVSGGWKVKCPYLGQKFDHRLFTIEKGGWDHGHCDLCSATIDAGASCNVSDDENRWVICEKCFAGLRKDEDRRRTHIVHSVHRCGRTRKEIGMNRREFSKAALMVGVGAGTIKGAPTQAARPGGDSYEEPVRKLPVRQFDVVVAGAGTGGVVAALAAARQGANTAVIEAKGYPGGTVTEGGTALHSFYNLWKAFPGVAKRQVVRGIPQEIVDRLIKVGGCSGHAEMLEGYNYDSVCTCIDTELYKLVTFEMLAEAGVHVFVNTLLAGAIMDGPRLRGVITESRSGREAFYARSFVDCTAYGDLAAYAGAKYTEPNDYPVCNSVGIGNVDIDKYYAFLKAHNATGQLALGLRSGRPGQIVRAGAESVSVPGMVEAARAIGMGMITTTVHDNYLMFIKCNFKMPVSPTNRDEVAKAELEIRRRMAKAVELFRQYVPGCEKAFMARTSPRLCIRRGRLIQCDYDIALPDVLEARHFDDEVMVYGFHDSAPRYQVKNGGTYGVPYRALRVAGIENLLAAGMMITSDHEAHMSTRNTVCCMGQGQGAGTAAALCAARNCGTRDLPYSTLRDALNQSGVYFET